MNTKKLVVGIMVLVVLMSIITIVDAVPGKKDKKFLEGKSKKEIEDTISKLSNIPLLVFAKEHGITKIRGKDIDPNALLNTPGGSNKGSPRMFADRPMGTDPNYWENEPSISANPIDSNIVVGASHKYPYATAPSIRCVAYRSTDGGATWSTPVTLPLVANTVCSDPVVRWAPNGSRVYASYMSYNSTNSYVIVARSINNGLTWIPRIAMTAGPGDFIDKPWMDVHTFWDGANATDKVYVSATRFTGSVGMDIVFARSYNGGVSFGATQTLATSPTGNPVLQGSRPIGGKSFSSSSGDVLVCWYNSGTDGWLTGGFYEKCRSSTNYGYSFGSEITAVNNKTYEIPYWLTGPAVADYHRWWGGMFPSITIAADGTAHMVFTAASYTGDDGDVYYVRSPRPYTTWSVARGTVNAATYYAQGFPTITAKNTSLGTALAVFWEDHRNSPYYTPADQDCGHGLGVGTAYNCYYDIYGSTTSPGGSDWYSNPNKRITDVSSISDASFLGDYIDSSTSAKSVSDLTAQVIWTDRSDATSVWDQDDDIYSDRVDIKNS